MNEKRYEYCRGKYRQYIQDREKDGVWREGYVGTYGEFDLDKITVLLNKLNDENQKLKKENEQLKLANGEMEDYLARLEEQRKICIEKGKWFNKTIQELNDENKQLKKDLKSYQNMVKQYINLHIDKILRRYVNPTKEEVAERTRIIRDLEQLKKELQE